MTDGGVHGVLVPVVDMVLTTTGVGSIVVPPDVCGVIMEGGVGMMVPGRGWMRIRLDRNVHILLIRREVISRLMDSSINEYRYFSLQQKKMISIFTDDYHEDDAVHRMLRTSDWLILTIEYV